jgi:hypothetical protein
MTDPQTASTKTAEQVAPDAIVQTGFRDTYVEHLVGPDSMVVGLK